MTCEFDLFQIQGSKTRLALAAILRHAYQSPIEDGCVCIRSRMVDEVTARRLGSVLFSPMMILDATRYQPVFSQLTTSTYGPFEDNEELKWFEFDPIFLELLMRMEPKELESLIGWLLERVKPELKTSVDIRFE